MMTVEQWLGRDNKIGIDLWKRKYRHGNETFDEWLDRVSNGNPHLRRLILEKKLLFGGRTMANRGTASMASYFNCYSHGYVNDDYEDIMQVAKNIGLTFKGEGGQGISLSKIRPKGTPVGIQYESDGIVPFMKIYNEVTLGTSQGGARKGALMISLDARHKEVENFIRIKTQKGLIESANLSLEIDDEFMQAVQKWFNDGERVVLHEEREYSGHIVEYDVVPLEVLNALATNSHEWADPAALFVNRFRNFNLMQYDDEYVIETSNPCGEQPLPKHGACCLASINLSEFIVNPYTGTAHFDTAALVEAVHIGIQALDGLIDENNYRHPLIEQQQMSQNYRNVGLGAMGYATALMKLGIQYGSDEALEITDQIFGLMFRAAVLESNRLAKEYGPFPKYKDCVWDSDIMKQHFLQHEIDTMREFGLRNCSLLSIAPTGSIATMLGESGGCEPEFAMKYTRRTVGMTDGDDTYYDVYCKAAREYIELYGLLEGDLLPNYFIEAEYIPWERRLKTQAIMQSHVDTAISSTVNLPKCTTVDEVVQLYLTAWTLGLKGVTIYRIGCKRDPILSTENKDEPDNEAAKKGAAPEQLQRGYILETSDKLIGLKRKLTTGCGSLHCEAYFDPISGELRETFFSKGSKGGCNSSLTGLSRSISIMARAGCSIDVITDQMISSIDCNSYVSRRNSKHDTSLGTSCPSAIGYALTDMWNEMQELLPYIRKRYEKAYINLEAETQHELKAKVSGHTASMEDIVDKCPECGMPIIFEGGCNSCKNCGYSRCD